MQQRSERGSQFMELAVGMLVSIPIFLALLELVMIVNVAQVADATAREASRVGAAGDPKMALQRIDNVIARANRDSHAMAANFKLESAIFNPGNILARESAMVPYGGTLTGDITVRVGCTVRPSVIGFIIGNQPITLNSQKTCPFTYNVPNTAAGIAPAP